MILEKKCREYTLIKVIHIGLKELIKNSLYSYKPNVAYSNYVKLHILTFFNTHVMGQKN